MVQVVRVAAMKAAEAWVVVLRAAAAATVEAAAVVGEREVEVRVVVG